MSQPTVIKKNFAINPGIHLQRSRFDMSCGYKTTFNAGFLIPIFFKELLPGDIFNASSKIFVRLLSPLKVPFMDNLYLDTHTFFVPNRLLQDNFVKMMGEQKNPGDSTDYLCPKVTFNDGFSEIQVPPGSPYDYFGIPVLVAGTGAPMRPNAYFFRAYNLIWNEWFRDENLQDSVLVPTDDGPDIYTNYQNLLPRGKRFDYFTQALTQPQKGVAASIPLGTTAPVISNGSAPFFHTPLIAGANFQNSTDGSSNVKATFSSLTAQSFVFGTSTDTTLTGLVADLSDASAATINQLRQAFSIQALLERDNRGGTRYTELLRAHYGVVPQDARLQRPEFCGGGSTRISTVPVPQTNATGTTGTPQANLAAFGVTFGDSKDGHQFKYAAQEHGVLITLMSVRADLTYQQGLDRMWSRNTRYDFFWPDLAHIGEQTILSKEIYVDCSADDNLVFGYRPKDDEYRFSQSLVTGLLRSQLSSGLDIWHLSQYFGSRPVLNDSFIKEQPPMTRVKAVTSEPDFICDIFHRVTAVRPLPMHGVPGSLFGRL